MATNFENNPAKRRMRELEQANKPHSFPAGSAGFMAFGPGSGMGNGYNSGNYAPANQDTSPGQYSGGSAAEAGPDTQRDGQDNEGGGPKKRRKGLGGWWYWWKN